MQRLCHSSFVAEVLIRLTNTKKRRRTHSKKIMWNGKRKWAHQRGFWILATAIRPSFTCVFWLTRRPFDSNMGIGRFRIEFRVGMGKKELVRRWLRCRSNDDRFFFSYALLLLLRWGLVQLGLRFHETRCLNILPKSIRGVHAGTHNSLPSVGSLLFGEWIWAIWSDWIWPSNHA